MLSTRFRSLPVSAALLSAMALPSLADVSAAQVWESWQQSLDLAGPDFDISFGEVTEAPGVITVENLRMTSDTDEADLDISISPLVFRETGDGRVDIELPSSIPIATKKYRKYNKLLP